MIDLLMIAIVLLSLLIAAYLGSGIVTYTVILAILAATSVVLQSCQLTTWLLEAAFVVSLLFSIPPLRRNLVALPALAVMRKILPPISPTEQEAIDAGTVWWDGEIFSGKPDWNKLLSQPKPSLTAEEQAFIDGPVSELSRMSNKWRIDQDWKTIPELVFNFIRRNGFLGMIIPKKYGGLELSPVAQSEVLVRLSNTGGGIANLVGVPNSLGPGELLLKYGTEEQKNHYLPRLANGDDVPCFALTGPTVGSDATSLPDTGIVCKGQWEGEEVLGMRLNFSKRYITLAPFATVIGLAFRLKDPDGLMGDVKDYGITCALIPRDVEGMTIGRVHLPVGDIFSNGPIQGKDVFVPLSFIIGGPEMAGKGWRMLVNCLSVGRSVTLPTFSATIGKISLFGTSAYANLRQQFGVTISQFEGIQKPLARIAGMSYIINAGRLHTIQSIIGGNKPSVPSAILKYHTTELARKILLDAMDVHGGKAVVKGPRNYITHMYESVPVAITVEGANILTRNLMIFGQGATRSHPFVLKEMQMALATDSAENLAEFDKALFGHIGFTVSNIARSLLMGLGVASQSVPTNKAHLRPYYKDINRLSSVFALTADIAMLNLGARLRFKEMLSARLGDLLSMLFLASMVMKQHEDNENNDEEWPMVKWSLDYLLNQYQVAFDELIQNWPSTMVAMVLKRIAFPIGRRYAAPSDQLEKEVVALISRNSKARADLCAGIFMENVPNNPVAEVNEVFIESLELKPINEKIKQAIRDGKLEKSQNTDQIAAAKAAGIITDDEAKQLTAFDEHVMAVINVEDFDESEIIRKAYDPNEDSPSATENN